MTHADVPPRAPNPGDPLAHELSGHPGRWSVWICRLAALAVWAVLAMGGLFLWGLSYAGPNRHDDHGMPLEPSQGEVIAVVTLLVVLLVLMLSAVEVPLRAGRRSTVRWFGSLGLGAAVLLYLSLESWNPAANVTSVGATIAIVAALLGGGALMLGTRWMTRALVPVGTAAAVTVVLVSGPADEQAGRDRSRARTGCRSRGRVRCSLVGGRASCAQ